MITGIGTDIVEIARIKKLQKKYGASFHAKILSEEEISLIPKGAPEAYIAGRFAAREALVKALGGKAFNFPHIIIKNDPEGKPYFEVPADLAPGTTLHLSISHERNYATAMVIAEKTD